MSTSASGEAISGDISLMKRLAMICRRLIRLHGVNGRELAILAGMFFLSSPFSGSIYLIRLHC